MTNKNVWISGAVSLLLAATFFTLNTGLPSSGAIALGIFLTAVWAWTFTRLDATLIAVTAALGMSACGLTSGKMPLAALGDPFTVFIIAGFMIGGAYKTTGLSERIAVWFAARSYNTAQMFYRITFALVLLSFVIPSTSARAAMLMPVYTAIAGATASGNIRKALAILFPTVIVLSCITSYLGAGANLMTADFIEQFGGVRISYGEWLLMGGPLGIISCFLSVFVILRVFLNKEERNMPFQFKKEFQQPDAETQRASRRTLLITGLLIAAWMTESLHGIDAGMVAVSGAVLLCWPSLGVITLKQAIKEVEWTLVIFMAATIELSHGLAQSGAVGYLTGLFAESVQNMTAPAVITAILGVALLSHLVIHSRTARASVMMPVLIPLGISAGHPVLLVAFLANAAMGYCLTLPVCAKPVALFSTAGEEGYETKDLVRLSAWLIPIHLVLLIGMFMVYRY